MQELRSVLIIVGGLAIIALLFHGLWTSKKESKGKFAEPSPQGDDELLSDSRDESAFVDDSDQVLLKDNPAEEAFGLSRGFASDPLGVDDPLDAVDPLDEPKVPYTSDQPEQQITSVDIENQPSLDDGEPLPSVKLHDEIVDGSDADGIIFSDGDEMISKPRKIVTAAAPEFSMGTDLDGSEQDESLETEAAEEELQVIVVHVHCNGDVPFVGTKLFDSMQQNGLIYGEMDIYHRHADLSGNGAVLFSVANMMQPGTLQHDDPETYTTMGISFFMTLPGFGDAEQNFKLMLRTAQQIADDLGANVLDDERNLMTPDRLAAYRSQIRTFKLAQSGTVD